MIVDGDVGTAQIVVFVTDAAAVRDVGEKINLRDVQLLGFAVAPLGR